MLSGFIMVGSVTILLGIAAVVFSLRVPRCPTCRIPLQTVEETVRGLGAYGVETVIYYEGGECYRDMRRVSILNHVG